MLGCIVLDEYRAFAVDFDKSKTVSHLKTAILEQKKKSFSDIEADQLTLWKVNIPQSNKWEIHTGVDIKQKFGGIELDDLTLIAKYFPEEPPEEYIHIIVQPPLITGKYLQCFTSQTKKFGEID